MSYFKRNYATALSGALLRRITLPINFFSFSLLRTILLSKPNDPKNTACYLNS